MYIKMSERLEAIAQQMINRAEAMWCEETVKVIKEVKKELLELLN